MNLRRSICLALATLISSLTLGGAARASQGTITEFHVANRDAFLNGIATGPDGRIWFTATNARRIGVITTNGSVRTFRMPAAAPSPDAITVGPDGNLWFTDGNAGTVGKITTQGNVSVLPLTFSFPDGITTGPDGNMWVADGENGGGNQIDRIPPDSPTSITRFDIPTPGANPIGIAAGADGNLWFVEQSASKLGRITTSGVITEWPTLSPKASPIGIAPGADGNMWFTESNGAKVGRITPDGAISEFPLDAGFGQPQGIVAGPDGNMWVAELDGPGIGEVTPSGDVTSFVTPTVPSGPTGICLGPDGNLWFTEESTGFIGELEDAQPQTAYVQSTAGGFSPPTVTAAQGVAVQWTFMGPTAQSVSDRSGLELFDSPSQLPVSYFSHTFTAAGTYGYMDAGGVSSGRIEVPVIAAPSSGGEETTFTITWASAPPPAGLVFEVQIKRPSTGWANWQDGVTNTSATFLPDGGTGTYGFRSRLVDPITHAHIAWSATIGISVS